LINNNHQNPSPKSSAQLLPPTSTILLLKYKLLATTTGRLPQQVGTDKPINSNPLSGRAQYYIMISIRVLQSWLNE